MKAARNSLYAHKAKEFEENAKSGGKGGEPLCVEAGKASRNTEEQSKQVKNRCEEKPDAWMKNIKEFIRNIDVKSL